MNECHPPWRTARIVADINGDESVSDADMTDYQLRAGIGTQGVVLAGLQFKL